MNLVHLIAYLIAAAVICPACCTSAGKGITTIWLLSLTKPENRFFRCFQWLWECSENLDKPDSKPYNG